MGTEAIEARGSHVLNVPARVWREGLNALLEYDDVGELGRVKAPTWLLWGDRDSLVGSEMQDQLAPRIPNAQLMIYVSAFVEGVRPPGH